MEAEARQTRRFVRGKSLFAFIIEHIPGLPNGSVLAIASKIVALSQHRWIDRPFTKEDVMKASDWSAETPYAQLTLVDGHWCPNAGMDASNADQGSVLWPTELESTADILCDQLKKHYNCHDLGLIITDSRVFPLRQGVTAVSLMHAGFRALRDYRGEPDLDGRPMRMTTVNVADALATTATFLMGEGNEQQPLCLLTGAPVVFCDERANESLFIAPTDDLFAPLYRAIPDFPRV
jgi:F420-0:gamma-glutamyl ligase